MENSNKENEAGQVACEEVSEICPVLGCNFNLLIGGLIGSAIGLFIGLAIVFIQLNDLNAKLEDVNNALLSIDRLSEEVSEMRDDLYLDGGIKDQLGDLDKAFDLEYVVD